MYFDDHNPPHFHVEYGGHKAIISIISFGIIQGKLPPRILGMITEWSALHQDELLETWSRAATFQPLNKIDPLP